MGKSSLVLLLALLLVAQVSAAPLQEMGDEIAVNAGGTLTATVFWRHLVMRKHIFFYTI